MEVPLQLYAQVAVAVAAVMLPAVPVVAVLPLQQEHRALLAGLAQQ
jgi:hypothetical protein